MEPHKVLSLIKTFPDVLLTRLTRMSAEERTKVLSEFEKEFPEEFREWSKSEIQHYLKSLERSKIQK